MSDAPEGLISGLEYIAASPSPEYGGFPTDVVDVAKGALAHIAALRKELAEAKDQVKRLRGLRVPCEAALAWGVLAAQQVGPNMKLQWETIGPEIREALGSA